MTDLEITRACAWAMGYWFDEETYSVGFAYEDDIEEEKYDPLHDDAQAMALVKKFNVQIEGYPGDYSVCVGGFCANHEHKDLNHAIVECVAMMQKAKVK